MCSTWNKIGRAFERHIELAGEVGFARLKAICPAFGSFAEAAEIVTLLDDAHESGPERDRIVSELARAATGKGPGGQLAAAILWRGYWSSLSKLLRSINTSGGLDPDELASDLAEKFTKAIHEHNAGGATRATGTLFKNARRDFLESLRKRRNLADSEVPFDDDAEYCLAVAPLAESIDSLFDMASELGEDAAIAIACVVEGLTAEEAAARFKISPDALRKRLQRSAERLRDRDARKTRAENVGCGATRRRNGPLGMDGNRATGGASRGGSRCASHAGGRTDTELDRRNPAPTNVNLGDIFAGLFAEADRESREKRRDVLVIARPEGDDRRSLLSSMVSYCDECRRWGARGTEHTCGQNWSEHLRPVLTTLVRRMS